MLHQAHAFAPIGCPVVDAANLVFVALGKLAPHHLVAAPPLFFVRFMGKLSFHHIAHIAVECAFFVEQGRGAGAEAMRAVVATMAPLIAAWAKGFSCHSANRTVITTTKKVQGIDAAVSATMAPVQRRR